MSPSHRLLALLLAAIPAACVTPPVPDLPGAPAWVRGPDPAFPEERLLLARAQSTNEGEARDRARAELGRRFVLRVESAGLSGESPATDGTRRLVALNDRIIEHIRVAARWQDPVKKTHHALASLPRDVAAEGLREAIASRDEEIRRALEHAGGSGDVLRRLRYLDRALELQVEREALHRLRSDVAPGAAPVSSVQEVTQLREAREKLFAEVRLAPQASADSTPGLDAALTVVLARTGLQAGNENEADYRLAARLVLEEGLSGGETVRLQGVLEVTLVERSGNRIRRSRRWLIRSEAPDRAAATRRALEEVTALLSRNLRRLLLDADGR